MAGLLALTDHPPRIRIDIAVDRKGVILDITARVQLWKDSPPTVGYSNCGAPPVGVDLKQVSTMISVLPVSVHCVVFGRFWVPI